MKIINPISKATGILNIIALLGVMLLISCGGGNMSDAERSEKMAEMRSLIDSRNFEIENQWVTPLRGNRINLIGNANYIRFQGDSVELFLPYFGVRHTGGGYNNDGGIKYEGLAKNLQVLEGKYNSLVLKFEGKQSTESYDFTVNVYSNLSTSTQVNSSDRDPVSYQGEIHEYKNK